ncbi:MAG TPA: family 78 glycoside hydrolase catalytic domain [Thermomicrobiales bacterium]|nr:family 78 glycoside hydrolase catalytic domain [Thermomicrobiales bacterium]
MSGTLTPTNLRADYLVNPMGIQSGAPLLSWELSGDGRGLRQTAWQVEVASSPDALTAGSANLWDSGKVVSGKQSGIAYEGVPLESRARASWRVRTWDGTDQPGAWSQPSHWEVGLGGGGLGVFRVADWSAKWISLPMAPDDPLPGGINEGLDALVPTTLVRRPFTVQRPVRRARLYVTARGVYEARINGAIVGDHTLAPGWVDYNRRQPYQVFNVTDLIADGDNVVAATIAPGWFSGYVGWRDNSRHYGTEAQFLAQLEIEYDDGETDRVATDQDWRASDGPARYADLIMGEYHDARLDPTGWDAPGFDDSDWRRVRVSTPNSAVLVGDLSEPVRALEVIEPVNRIAVDDRTVIFDLGQNIAGRARITVSGPAGSIVRLRFAEWLQEGTLYTENLRRARATDTYVLAGGGQETWEPRFTFHGFQYVELSGDPDVIATATAVGRFVGSDTRRVGHFECSDDRINQLYRNIVWGQRDNFLSIPTDCPQRDERLGWTGDAQVFIRTATTTMDVMPFFRKWMVDVIDAQRADGAFSDVVPNAVILTHSAPAWADCGIIAPWTLWQVYGDTRIIDDCWDAMVRYLDNIERRNPDGRWVNDRGNDFGDWLSIDANTDKELIGTGFWGYDARLMAEMARATDRHDAAARFEAMHRRVAEAFVAAYVAEDGTIRSGTQTAYLMALRFGLLPDHLIPLALEHLVADIRARGTLLTTGFVGVSYLCPVLTAHGHADAAWDLLFQDRFPSWLYPVAHGATTIWERWDGWTEHKGFQDPGMNSFNHYSLGSIGEWLMASVAGIDTDPEAPGFERVRITPLVDHRLDHAGATYDSIRGRIASSWRRDGETIHFDVTLPPNTTATVRLPNPGGAPVIEGSVPVETAEGISGVRARDGVTELVIGSGSYAFRVG